MKADSDSYDYCNTETHAVLQIISTEQLYINVLKLQKNNLPDSKIHRPNGKKWKSVNFDHNKNKGHIQDNTDEA